MTTIMARFHLQYNCSQNMEKKRIYFEQERYCIDILLNHIFLPALAAIAMQHLPTSIVHVELVDFSEDFVRSWQLISC